MAIAPATKAQLQELRSLVRSASDRRKLRRFVVEGPVLVAEVMKSSMVVHHIVGVAELLEPHSGRGVPLFEVPSERLVSVLSTQSPQPIAAVVEIPASLNLRSGPILAQVDMGDPGNVGTMIRTAEAADMAAVALVGNCVDQWNPKVIRASAGASLRLPVCALSVDELFGLGRGPVLATVVEGGVNYQTAELHGAIICLGNEAHGLPSDFVARCDQSITIPLAGPTESLNVGAAAAIVVFAALEQRRAITIAGSS